MMNGELHELGAGHSHINTLTFRLRLNNVLFQSCPETDKAVVVVDEALFP